MLLPQAYWMSRYELGILLFTGGLRRKSQVGQDVRAVPGESPFPQAAVAWLPVRIPMEQ